jgi:hypothetical protein
MRDAMSKRVRLARAGACDDQQRSGNTSVAMLDRAPLFGVQSVEIGRLKARITEGDVHRGMKHRSWLVRNAGTSRHFSEN